MNRAIRLPSFALLTTVIFAVASVGGCDVVTGEGDLVQPFSGPGWNDEEGVTLTLAESGKVVVGATHLDVMDDDDAQAQFDAHMTKLQAALETQPGLIGTSLRSNLFNNDRYMTLSVWASEDDMMAWVVSDVHAAAMAEFRDFAATGRSTSWIEDEANLPLSWDTVLEKLDDDGTVY